MISIKFPKIWISYLEKIAGKKVITKRELAEEIWITKDTFYNTIKKWKASHKTIKKLKEFLKSNWYDVE